MKTWVLRFVFGALLALGLSLTATAQTAPGVIKVGKVQGSATRLTASGAASPVKAGDSIQETDTITTAEGSLVVLVFMNGSSVKIGAKSKLSIEEFKMDPLAEDVVVSKLGNNEPSVSKTVLNLAEGELVGDVKKLNIAKGSSFNIKTPVGAAGIRGTQFRIVFIPKGDGRSFTMQLQTADGHVVFTTQAQAAPVDVLTQKEIVITAEVSVDKTTGAVSVVSVDVPPAATTLSTADTTAITTTATTLLQETAKTTVITVTEQQAASSNTNSGTSGTSGSNDSNSGTSGDSSSSSNNQTTGDSSSGSSSNSNSSSESGSGSNSGNSSNSGSSSNSGTGTNPSLPTTRPPGQTPTAGGG
jgi:hypothetical protein